jgi:hypothetical protein
MATPSKCGSSHINLALDTEQALFTRQVPYNAEVLGLVGSPAIGSVQTTLDGGVLSEEDFGEVVDEMNRVPCDKRCLLALEDECRCRCGGINHGLWVKGASRDTSLDIFDSEDMPVISHDIARGRLELILLARKEVVAAYGSLLGGLRG